MGKRGHDDKGEKSHKQKKSKKHKKERDSDFVVHDGIDDDDDDSMDADYRDTQGKESKGSKKVRIGFVWSASSHIRWNDYEIDAWSTGTFAPLFSRTSYSFA